MTGTTRDLTATAPAIDETGGVLLSRVVRRLVAAAVVAVLLVVAGTAVSIWWTARQDDRPRSDAIVVLGVPFEQPAEGATPTAVPDESFAAQLAVLSAAQELSSGAVLADAVGDLHDGVRGGHGPAVVGDLDAQLVGERRAEVGARMRQGVGHTPLSHASPGRSGGGAPPVWALGAGLPGCRKHH